MDIKVTLLGTGAGVPIPGRAQSGILVEVPKHKILLDCGMGTPLRIAESGTAVDEIDTICLTHEHLDHIQDLPALIKASWLKNKEAKYKIIVPKELKKRLINIFRCLDAPLFDDKNIMLNFEVLNPEEEFQDSFSIKAFDTLHTDMSQGYEITHDGKRIIYTGDTEVSEKIKNLSENVDILIHELSSLKKTKGHTDTESFISTFADTSPKLLILTHFYPDVAEKIKEVTKKIEKETGIQTISGKDLRTIQI